MAWQTILVPLHPRTRRTADGTYYTHDGTGRLRVREHHVAELGRQGGVRPQGTAPPRAQQPFIPTPVGGPPPVEAPPPAAAPRPVRPEPAPLAEPPEETSASADAPPAPKRGKAHN